MSENKPSPPAAHQLPAQPNPEQLRKQAEAVANLAEAVKAANFAQVRALLHARPELIHMDMSSSNEHRALHYAVLRRDAAMVRLLMEAGADARKGIYPHRDATSALAIAREREYTDIVAVIEEEERLRREELSCPNATVSPVQNQINKAIAEADNARAIQLLDADKTLIQACDRNGGTPLHITAEEGNQQMLEWLLARRANVHKRDIRGRTPLDRAALAAADDFPVIANLLLNHGAELTIQGAVALGNAARVRECLAADPAALRRIEHNGGLLTLAVNHAQLEIVQLLLDLGADVDERLMLQELEEPTLSWGMPLWHAALANNLAVTQLLLDRGADPNANVYASGWPLSRAWNHKDDSVKRLLLERGAKRQPHMIAETHDVAEARRLLQNAPTEDLVHELLWPAAEYGCPAIIELALPLVKWPLDDPRWHWVMIQPIRGATGSIEGNFATMTLLLQYGVNPNISRYGQTPLHFAAAYCGKVRDAARARFAALLLDFGARLDLRDDLLQSTPLAWACRWGRKELAELLIARRAPIDEPDAQAWATPVAWAAKMNHGAILTLLQNHRSAVR